MKSAIQKIGDVISPACKHTSLYVCRTHYKCRTTNTNTVNRRRKPKTKTFATTRRQKNLSNKKRMSSAQDLPGKQLEHLKNFYRSRSLAACSTVSTSPRSARSSYTATGFWSRPCHAFHSNDKTTKNHTTHTHTYIHNCNHLSSSRRRLRRSRVNTLKQKALLAPDPPLCSRPGEGTLPQTHTNHTEKDPFSTEKRVLNVYRT